MRLTRQVASDPQPTLVELLVAVLAVLSLFGAAYLLDAAGAAVGL